jgi:uncharacterized protein (TIGR03089 family)
MSSQSAQPATTIPELLSTAIGDDPARPRITYYDGSTGERTELSGATLENWVAKTANLIVDGAGLGPGDTAGVDLPPHWQSAAVLLGCWAAGLAVTQRPGGVDVAFVAADRTDRAWQAVERYVLDLAPMAVPMRDVPAGWQDYVAEVRPHGDRFVPAVPVPAGLPALTDHGRDGLDQRAATTLARQRAVAADLGPGDRVLLDADALPDPVDWLLAPLAAGASVVLCRACDRAARLRIRQNEKVTR